MAPAVHCLVRQFLAVADIVEAAIVRHPFGHLPRHRGLIMSADDTGLIVHRHEGPRDVVFVASEH
jgi:hypothetical protein